MDAGTAVSLLVALLALLGIGVAYEWRARAGGESARPRGVQRLMFHAGLVVLAIALASPVRVVADFELFTVHAVQHLLLTLAAPPLLIAGVPGGMVRPLVDRGIAGRAFRALTPATRAFLVFNVLLAGLHLPPIYAAGIASPLLRSLMYVAMVGASVLVWWPLLSPLPELPRLSYPLQMLYCFALSIPMSIVSVYIVAAGSPMYPYGDAAARWGTTALEDQRLGGLIMWVPSGLFFYVVLSIVFWKWQSHGGGNDTAEAAQVPARVPPPPPLPQP
jgi:putative membrane protein